MTEGPEGKTEGKDACSHNGAQNDRHTARLRLIKPEINHVADAIIAASCRNLVKLEIPRAHLQEPLCCGPRVAPHVMVNYTVVNDVTGEAELPSPIAVL
jgi:hypothetical protein